MISLPENITLPLTLAPKEFLTINAVVTPLHLGKFDSLVQVLTSDRIYVKHLSIPIVTPNKFGLTPIFYPTVSFREEISHALNIANPLPRQVYIEEFYLTNNRFKAEFKVAKQ